MAKQRFLYQITISEMSPKEFCQAYERLLKLSGDRKSTLSYELTKCINEYLDSPFRRIEDLESSLHDEQSKRQLNDTLRKIEQTTAEHKITKAEARIKELTEAVDLLTKRLETMTSVSVVAHKQGATSTEGPPSVH